MPIDKALDGDEVIITRHGKPAPERAVHIAAAPMVDTPGRLLLVRKRGTAAFMLSGSLPLARALAAR